MNINKITTSLLGSNDSQTRNLINVGRNLIKQNIPTNFVEELRLFATSPFRVFDEFAAELSKINNPQQQNFIRKFAQIKSKTDPFVWAEDFLDIANIPIEKQPFALELAGKKRTYSYALRTPLYNPPQIRPNDVTGTDIVNLLKVPEDRRKYIDPLLSVQWLEDLRQVFRGRHIAKILTETEPQKLNHAVYDLLLPGKPTSITYTKGRFGVEETVEQLINLVNNGRL